MPFRRGFHFTTQEPLIRAQKVLANLGPLQLILNPPTTISPHFISKLRFVHKVGDSFREFGLVVRLNVNGSVSGRKARFLKVERHDRLCRGGRPGDPPGEGRLPDGTLCRPDAGAVRGRLPPVAGLGGDLPAPRDFDPRDCCARQKVAGVK